MKSCSIKFSHATLLDSPCSDGSDHLSTTSARLVRQQQHMTMMPGADRSKATLAIPAILYWRTIDYRLSD